MRGASAAGVARRFVSMLYESLLISAVSFAAALLFLIPARSIETQELRMLFQAYLLAVCGGYLVWNWRRGGQTLSMKTWHLKLVGESGAEVTLKQALARYLLLVVLLGALAISLVWGFAHRDPLSFCAGIAIGVATYGWALVDRDRQFLYDRLAGTRIVNSEE